MKSFTQAFQDEDAVRHYDDFVYRPGNYDSTIWDLQQTFLRGWLGEFRSRVPRVSSLDFACGTGRVTALVEEYSDDTTGLDISHQMVALAQGRTRNATLRVGDLLAQPDIVGNDYDLITAFRFFLNAEPDLRSGIMRSLASRLRDGSSRLVFNIHGHSRSVRHLSPQVRNGGDRRVNEMSLADVRRLTDEAGLEIELCKGFGLLPRMLYSTRLCPLARAMDRGAASRNWLTGVSCDLLFVCRRKAD